MRFRTTIQQSGKSATGIRVPDDVIAALDAGKRPAVRVTINGYTYRSTVAVMGGAFMIALSAENRTGASVAGGDEVDVDLELDTAPREIRAVTTLSLIGGVIAGERRQKETMPPPRVEAWTDQTATNRPLREPALNVLRVVLPGGSRRSRASGRSRRRAPALPAPRIHGSPQG